MDQDLLSSWFGEPYQSPAELARKQALMQASQLRGQPQPPMPQPQPQSSWDAPPPQMPQQPPQAGPQAAPRALPQAMGQQRHAAPPTASAPVDGLGEQYQHLLAAQQEAAKAQEAAYAPPDYSKMEEYGRQRGQQGGQHLLMALMAQEAGKDFAPMQAQFLKQAAEYQQPMKVTGGQLTDQGFQADPGYAHDLKVKQADARAATIDKALQGNLSLQERDRLEKMRLDAATEMKQLTLGMMGSNRQFQQDMGRGREEDRLASHLDTQIKPYQGLIDKANHVQSIIEDAARTGRKLTQPEQSAIIDTYGQSINPGGMVRNEMYKRFSTFGGLMDRVQNYTQNIQAGSTISPQVAADMSAVIKGIAEESRNQIEGRVGQTQSIAGRRGLNPENVVTNPQWLPSNPDRGVGSPGKSKSWNDLP